MTNRRQTLLALAGVWSAAKSGLALAQAPNAPPAPPQRPSIDASSNGFSDAALEKQLREDLAGLGSRAYSDDGIPVFLACEDVVAIKAHGRAAAPPASSQSVATELRRNGAAWLRIYPQAPATDISKLIEVLAERDFRVASKAAGS